MTYIYYDNNSTSHTRADNTIYIYGGGGDAYAHTFMYISWPNSLQTNSLSTSKLKTINDI